MVIVMWIVVGFVAGYLAKIVVPGKWDEPSDAWGTTVLGIAGAIVGGFVYHMLTGSLTFRTSWDLSSIFWAALGAVLIIVIARLITGRPASE